MSLISNPHIVLPKTLSLTSLSRPPCTLRKIHATRPRSARPAPRPSPRVRDAQRQTSGRGSQRAGESIEVEAALPSLQLLTQAYMEKRIAHDPSTAMDFLREFATKWNQHKKDGPWQKTLCDEYSITPSNLYTLFALPFLLRAPSQSAPQSNLSGLLLRQASIQKHVPASMLILNSYLHRKREIPSFSPEVTQLNKAAQEGDAQATTLLSLVLKFQGKDKEARRWLETAVGWPGSSSVATSVSLPSRPQQAKSISSTSPAEPVQSPSKPAPIEAKDLNLCFPGANEALRTLGLLYLSLHTASNQSPLTSATKSKFTTPTNSPEQITQQSYLSTAKTAFQIAITDLNDIESYTHFLPLLSPSDPSRETHLLRAAASGNITAWQMLAGRKTAKNNLVAEGEGEGEGKVVEAGKEDEILETPVSQSTRQKREVVVDATERKKWRQEWDVLLSRWEGMEDAHQG